MFRKFGWAFLAAIQLGLPFLAHGEKLSGSVDPADMVRSREMAFAQTMAQRDHDAFAEFLAEEAIFFGSQSVLRGKTEVASGWKPFFEGETAPFSWKPEVVEVLESGTLALSSGPVFNPAGELVGTYNSIWRLGPAGIWKVVFDKGSPVCPE